MLLILQFKNELFVKYTNNYLIKNNNQSIKIIYFRRSECEKYGNIIYI